VRPARAPAESKNLECPNRVRPVRPLDKAVLTIRETPLHRPPHGRRMTYGTSANTYLVGRRSSRWSPDRRSRTVPIGKGPAIQHERRGLIALTAHFAHSCLAHHPQTPGSKTSRPRDQLRLRNLETGRPPGQDVQINYLDTLAIFVKQTTYLATLPLFGHLALVTLLLFDHLAQSLPRVREIQKTKRNLFCATPLRSPQDLVRLLRFLRTFCTAFIPPRVSSQPGCSTML
jgi:hypothetical protein